jgi:hypothetical protein
MESAGVSTPAIKGGATHGRIAPPFLKPKFFFYG